VSHSEYIDVRHNRLFAFTGIDGAGKSTLINGVSDTLQSHGHTIHVSKAYGGEQKAMFGERVPVADDAEIMFMFQSFHRRQRNETVRALEQGHVVLADRWDEAFDEYHSQHGPLSRDEELRRQISRLAFEGLQPHNTFYVQLDPHVAKERMGVRGSDFFDQKPLEDHTKKATYYDERALGDNSWVTLDGRTKPGELVERTVEIIDAGLSGNR
jgi:thymidylate kinase